MNGKITAVHCHVVEAEYKKTSIPSVVGSSLRRDFVLTPSETITLRGEYHYFMLDEAKR